MTGGWLFPDGSFHPVNLSEDTHLEWAYDRVREMAAFTQFKSFDSLLSKELLFELMRTGFIRVASATEYELDISAIPTLRTFMIEQNVGGAVLDLWACSKNTFKAGVVFDIEESARSVAARLYKETQ